MIPMKNSLVSVCMITYNHANYIEKAIEGVFMQEGDFDIELIISNDASSDETDLVIRNYIEDHPLRGKVKYICHSENIGVGENFNFALQKCEGTYIALCEGDDYWTDPLKLQKQVDFLKSNPDFIACGHNRFIYNEIIHSLKKQTLKKDMLKTQCVVFRNDNHIRNSIFQDYFVKVLNMDNFLFDYLSRFGKITNLQFYGAVYRISETGIFATKHNSFKYPQRLNTLNTLISLYKKLNIPFDHVQISKGKTIRNQAFYNLKTGQITVANNFFKEYVAYRLSRPHQINGLMELVFSMGKYLLLFIGFRNNFNEKQ